MSFTAPAQAAAGINKTLNFQGRLLNAAGAVVADGNYNMRMKIYQDGPGNVAGDTGGTLMWTELWQNSVATGSSTGVVVKNGYFSVSLASYCAFAGGSCQGNTNTAVDFNQDTLWLSMDVGGTAVTNTPTYDGELLPMRRMASAVYSLQAENANKLGGLTSSQFLQTVPGSTAINTIAPTAASTVALTVKASTAGSTNSLEVFDSSNARQAFFDATGNLNVAKTIQPTVTNTTDIGLTGTQFRTGYFGTSVITPLIDTNSAVALNIGTTNATSILLNQSTTVAAGKSLTITGGNTASRPGSPTEGMLYYDTTTKSLLVYANAKWQADRSTATKIVGTSASGGASSAVASQNPDGAEYVNASTTSAQTVINSAISALPAGGGTVYLMDGTYIIDGGITLPSNVTITGSGDATIIKIKNSHNATIKMLANADTTLGNSNITITNLKLDGNRANNSAVYQAGIDIETVGATGTDISNITVRGVTFTGLQSYAVYAQAQHSLFTANRIDNTSVGIQNDYGDRSQISDNMIYIYTEGIVQYGSANSLITNNRIYQSSYPSGSAYGIDIGDNMDGTIVSGNTITGLQTSAITAWHSSKVTISNNTIRNSGGSGSTSAIELTGPADRMVISGNSITDTAGTGFAILVDAAMTNTYLYGNTYSGTGAASISDSGVGTIYANQLDGSGNLINKSQGGGLTVGAASATASLTLQGGLVATALPAPTLSATVTNVGTAGSTTYRYQITARDGLGETTGSTIQQTTTGNATLSGSNYNTITWTPVGGAYQYRVYRCTGAACTPALLATVAGNTSSYNDIAAGSPSGAVPGSNTTGGGSFAGLLTAGASLNVTGTATASVSLVTPLLDTASAVALNIGTANATTVNIATNAAAHTVAIASGAAVQGVTIGSTNSTSSLTLQSGTTGTILSSTGTLAVKNGANNLVTVDSTGKAVFRPSADAVDTFQVQKSNGEPVLKVDSTNNRVKVGDDTAAAYSTIAFVGQAINNGTAVTTLTLTRTTTTGNLLVISVGTNSTAGTYPSSIADTAGNTWVQADTTYGSAGTGSRTSIWYAANANSITSATITMNSGADTTANLSEYSGVALTSPLDTTATNVNATTTTHTTGTASTSLAGDLLVGNMSYNNITGITTTAPGGSWTALTDVNNTTTKALRSVYQISGAAGSYSATWTTNSSTTTGAVLAAFKPAPGATTSSLFVVDNSTTAAAPGGVNGGMYYDTTLNKFRCFEGGSYVNCTAAGSILQAPTSTATNTITPTTASVVGLTVNATSGTSDVAAIFNQANNTSPADTIQVNSTNTSGTQTNGLVFNRNGTGGTTTNGLNVTNTLGTTTNGLQLTQSGGTFTTGINFTGTFGNLIVAPNFSVSNAGTLTVNGGSTVSKTLTVNGGTQNVETLNFTTTADSSGTNTANGLNIATTIGNATAGTNSANIINIGALTGDAQVVLSGIKIGVLTTGNATDAALNIGTGWGDILRYNGAQLISGTGVLQSAGLSGSYTGITGTGALAAGSLAAGFTTVAATVGGTGQSSYAVGDLLYASSTTALSRLADVSSGQCLLSGGVGVAPAWAACPGGAGSLIQVPTSTATNTITPTTASVVGLTVNATTSTSAVAAIFNQANNTSPADTIQVNSTNTSGTQTNGLVFNRNGTGGTTTNGLNVTNTLGTTTNGLQLTQSGGTFTTGINFTGTFGNLIVAPNFSVSNAGTLTVATSLVSPLLDTASAVALNIGTTNATAINLNQSTTIAANKSLTLTSGTGAFTQTATSVAAGDAHSITATGLTSGTAFKVTSTSNTGANTAWSANSLNVTNAQGTTAVTSMIAGLDVQFTQNTTVAGNAETVANFAVAANASSSTDATIASILNLSNNDTATGNQITVTDALKITGGSNIVNGINLSGTFSGNLISSSNFNVTQAGQITAGGAVLTSSFDAASATTLTIGGTNATSIQLGGASNNLTIGSTGEPTLNGTARHTRQILLSPEYAGASMSADGSSNNGSMTSDNMAASPYRNYYQWATTQGTAQDYDIWVKIALPSDFAAWPTSQTLCLDTYASATTANGVKLNALYDTSNAAVTISTTDLTPTSTTTWQNKCSTSITSGTFAAGGVITLDLKLTAPATTGIIRIGDLSLNYLSKW